MIASSYHLIVTPPLSLDVGHCFVVVVVGIQCPPIDSSTDSCILGALAGGDKLLFFYSTILKQSLTYYFNFNG